MSSKQLSAPSQRLPVIIIQHSPSDAKQLLAVVGPHHPGGAVVSTQRLGARRSEIIRSNSLPGSRQSRQPRQSISLSWRSLLSNDRRRSFEPSPPNSARTSASVSPPGQCSARTLLLVTPGMCPVSSTSLCDQAGVLPCSSPTSSCSSPPSNEAWSPSSTTHSRANRANKHPPVLVLDPIETNLGKGHSSMGWAPSASPSAITARAGTQPDTYTMHKEAEQKTEACGDRHLPFVSKGHHKRHKFNYPGQLHPSKYCWPPRTLCKTPRRPRVPLIIPHVTTPGSHHELGNVPGAIVASVHACVLHDQASGHDRNKCITRGSYEAEDLAHTTNCDRPHLEWVDAFDKANPIQDNSHIDGWDYHTDSD